MDKVRVYYDRTGNTLTVWFDDLRRERLCEEIDEDVVLMKDTEGKSNRVRAVELPVSQAAGRGVSISVEVQVL